MVRLLCMIALIVVTNVANAIEDRAIQRSMAVNNAEKIVIQVERGNISIKGVDTSDVIVSGELDESTEEVIFERKGDTIVFKLKIEQDHWGSGKGANLDFKVPKSFAANVMTVSAEVLAENLMSNVFVKSVSGDITVNEIGKAEVTESELITVSGDIDFKRAYGRLDLNSVSGDIEGSADSHQIRAKTVSGELRVKLNRVQQAFISSVSGDVSLSGVCEENLDVKMSTVNGEAKLLSDGTYVGKLKMQTGPGGDIVNRLSKHKPESSLIGDAFLQVNVGEKSSRGSNRVDMTTVSGTLIID
ncbi:MAG: DUF4097 family beta strand repeat protein [Gammaproteobacteria bacterium]|nr:DUF4097 family beta strand repeat protein [Gammaproteobacteria bacterium]